MLAMGIIGNFSGHLSSAENVEEGQYPSGIFIIDTHIKETITDSAELHFPKLGQKVDIEPEFVLRCKVGYENNQVVSLMPTHITVGNDMTIRELEGSNKISQRKSWGYRSKGLNSDWWSVVRLSPANYDENIRLVSYVERDEKLFLTTPEVNCTELKVFYCHLMAWMVDQINHQKGEGIFDEIMPTLKKRGYPTDLLLYTGAPNYTPWGESNYVKCGDKVHIAAFNASIVDASLIEVMFESGTLINSDAVLSYSQTIVKG